MSRNLTAGALAQTTADTMTPILLAELEFPSGFVRVWSGYGNLIWNGNTFIGTGLLGNISPIEETSEIRASGIKLSLSGIPSSLLAVALGEVRQGRSVKVWIAFLDALNAIIPDPYLAFSGRMDVPEILESGETSTISLSAESRLIDLEKPRERRYTDQDQRIRYPDDRGFEFVPSIQEADIRWGQS